MAPIQINNDGYGNSCLRSRYRNDKNGKEHPVEPLRVKVFVERYKIDIHTVQDQLDSHEHGDQVAAGEQSIHADKEQRRTYK
jgi:hypothetical protein